MPLARAIALVTVIAGTLQSANGRALTERTAGASLVRWLGARVRFGRVSGSLLFDFEVRDLDVTLAGGGWLRAAKLRARYTPTIFGGGKPRVAIELERPVVRLPSRPRLPRARWPLDGAVAVTITIHDGRVAIAGAPPLTHVEAELTASVGARGRTGEVALRVLSGRVETPRGELPWRATASARWDARRGTLTADAPLALAHSRAHLHASWTRDTAELALDDVRLAREDLRALAPGVEPLHPVTAWIRARGPLDALALDGAIDPGRGRVTIAGTLDARALRGRARVTLDGVEPDFVPSAAPMVASGAVELAATRARLGFTLRGEYHHRLIDPQLAVLAPAGTARDRQTARFGPGGSLDGACALERRGAWIGACDVRVRDAGAGTRSVLGRAAPTSTLLVHARRERTGALRVDVRSDGENHAR